MKLLIISNMPHHVDQGVIVGWGPTVQEIDALSTVFDEIVHLGCLYTSLAPESSLGYQRKNIKFIPFPPTGGETFQDKLEVLKMVPTYIHIIKEWLSWADMVHVRAPANTSLIGMLMLWISPIPPYRWIKYAGNWKPESPESWSYTLQRWILEKNLHRGMVTINGQWQNQPDHIYSFLNPSLKVNDLDNIDKPEFKPPYRLLFAGRVEEAKGVGRLLEIGRILQQRKIEFRIDIIGDGPEKAFFEELTKILNLSEITTYHGWKPQPMLKEFYLRSHFFILPSISEGWPKVLSEAMAYGVVPLAGAVSSIPQILRECKTGMALNPLDTQAFANAICDYIDDPSRWNAESRAAQQAAYRFTYEAYLEHLTAVFEEKWQINLK